MMALTKLERGPKRISLKSLFDSGNMTRFLREAGISYNALVTKKFKSDNYMDISTFSIESWISGLSHFAAMWHNLFEVMKNIDYASNSDKSINKDVKGFKEMAKAIEHYLKEMDLQHSTSNVKSKVWHNIKDNLDGKYNYISCQCTYNCTV